MNTVYILQSIDHPEQFYTGLCKRVEKRLGAHNAGQSAHTSKFKPWRLLSAHHFADPKTAAAFEPILSQGQGEPLLQSGLDDPKPVADLLGTQKNGGVFRRRR